MMVIESIQDRLSRGGYAPRTLESYTRLTNLVSSHPLAWLPVEDPRARDAAQSLINSQLVAGHGRTAEQLYVWLRTCCPDLMATIPRPRYQRRRPVYMSADDATRLLKAAEGTPVWLAIALALSCGLRRGELCGLRWSDIEMSATRCVINIRQQVQRLPGAGLVARQPKTESGVRYMAIPRHLTEALAERYLIAQADGLLRGQKPVYVLEGPKGGPMDPSALSRAVQAACEAAGVRCTLHGLRHTMASIGACAGVPMPVLQAILGHASPQTTAQYYTHAYSDAVETGLETINKRLKFIY